MDEAKTWQIAPDEVQVSYDVVNLYPSVPIKESIDVLISQLEEDRENLKNQTKLQINEIKELLELCLSKCYFLYNGEIHKLENKGPIGLSLMVTMAESYLQHLEDRAIENALHSQPPMNPKTHRRYVDDSHSRFEIMNQASRFLIELNSQDERVQYTMETEAEDKSLAFLNVNSRNTGEGSYEFKIHRKKAITNVQVRPESGHDPNILSGIFKGFVHQALKICSPLHLEDELEFLVGVFKENGYDEKTLRKWMRQVRVKLDQRINPTTETNDNAEQMQTVTLPWIPGVSPSLKKVFRKAGFKVAFKAGANLQTILSKKNKVKLPPNSNPGVYMIPCLCGVPPYVGETKLRTCTRLGQHHEYISKEQWERSGVAQHAKTCPAGPDFANATTLKTEGRHFERSVRETLEIQRHRSAPKFGGMNRDEGQYVKTSFWMPFMDTITKEEREREKKSIRRRERETDRIHERNPTSDIAIVNMTSNI